MIYRGIVAAPTQASALKELRKAADLTQAELARRIGVDAMTVSRWERGAISDIKSGKLAVLARELRVPVAELTKRLGIAGDQSNGRTDLPRQLEQIARDFEREMLESAIDDEFIRYARRRMRDPELLEMYAGGHVERAMTAQEQLDDYEDLIDELRGRLKRRLALLKKGGAPE